MCISSYIHLLGISNLKWTNLNSWLPCHLYLILSQSFPPQGLKFCSFCCSEQKPWIHYWTSDLFSAFTIIAIDYANIVSQLSYCNSILNGFPSLPSSLSSISTQKLELLVYIVKSIYMFTQIFYSILVSLRKKANILT